MLYLYHNFTLLYLVCFSVVEDGYNQPYHGHLQPVLNAGEVALDRDGKLQQLP